MDTSVVSNNDIQCRLEALSCCVAKSGVKLSNKLKIGQPSISYQQSVMFATAFLNLFEDYTITEATSNNTFVDNTCVPLDDFNKIVDFINTLCTCEICFEPYGTYGSSFDGISFDNSFN